MKQVISLLFQISICAAGSLYAGCNDTLAQVTSDETVNTQVDQNGRIAEITGGEMRGSNLFHSFQEFSVTTGNEAYFNNANNISNIFSRVTGRNISNIDGLIRANGSASLFLINPAGIIFGENAQLNIGGSFLSSTADSILFEEGEFSVSDLDTSPLLTINAPRGLSLPDNPAEIVNRSTIQDSEFNSLGLEVSSGNNLSLVGGNIRFEGSNATALGGNVELGGLSTAGTIRISEDGSLSFPEDVAKANVTLSNGTGVDVSGTDRGSITIDASNLELTSNSFLKAGITADSTSSNAQAGDIEINLSDSLTLNNSIITNLIESEGVGNAGNVRIDTDNLTLTNGGQVSTLSLGQGDAGFVNITATNDLTIKGKDSDGFSSGVFSEVGSEALGNAGSVIISISNLTLKNGGVIFTSTNGRGNAGSVDITATGDITIEGEDSDDFPSQITSLVGSEAVGNAGNVTIFTSNLILKDGKLISASTNGQGDAGSVNITATENILIEGEDSGGSQSSITSRVNFRGNGDAGNVIISANNLTLKDGGLISASTFGQGNAGSVNITALGDITIEGEDSSGSRSSVTSRVNPEANGDAGSIIISANNLTLRAGGRVASSTNGRGNAGSVDITATRDIIIEGEDSDGSPSAANSRVNPRGNGDAGSVTISANNLTLRAGGRVSSSTNGRGSAGSVDVTATGNITIEGGGLNAIPSEIASLVNPRAVGNGGNVFISTGDLTLRDGGIVSTSTFGQGDGGSVDITATRNITLENRAEISAQAIENSNGGNVTINNDNGYILALVNENNDIIANAEQGQGGNIEIATQGLFGLEERSSAPDNQTNDIDASSDFGLSGTVDIDILNADPSQDSLDIPVATVETKVAQTCEPDNDGNQSEFVVTGRGGLPESPEANLDGDLGWEDWQVGEVNSFTLTSSSNISSFKIEKENPEPIVEANSWIINDHGKVVLVAHNASNISGELTQKSSNCQTN